MFLLADNGRMQPQTARTGYGRIVNTIQRLRDTYRDALYKDVVPFWQRYSPDRHYGGFFTCLDRDGSIYATDKYLWLQGRAVWMFARLYREQRNPQWLQMAMQGAQFLRKHGRTRDGRVYFAVTRDGRPIHIQRKIYSEVFYVLAMIAMYQTTDAASYRDEAMAMFERIYELWRHPTRLGRPRLAGRFRGSVLAEPMVFLCMLEELAAAGVIAPYAHLRRRMVDRALLHIKPEQERVLEYVGPSGETVQGPRGRLMNPGHAIELGWFMLHYAQAANRPDIAEIALKTIEWSLRVGWDKKHGGLLYFLDCDGRPPLQLEWSMKLWWPHCEALYATILAWTITRDRRWLRWHEKIRIYAFKHFGDPACGEWYGYLDREGRPTHQLKGGEWKGFFHLPRALLYCAAALEKAHSAAGWRECETPAALPDNQRRVRRCVGRSHEEKRR
jgi:N-acylglucosamine 2-epimerase